MAVRSADGSCWGSTCTINELRAKIGAQQSEIKRLKENCLLRTPDLEALFPNVAGPFLTHISGAALVLLYMLASTSVLMIILLLTCCGFMSTKVDDDNEVIVLSDFDMSPPSEPEPEELSDVEESEPVEPQSGEPDSESREILVHLTSPVGGKGRHAQRKQTQAFLLNYPEAFNTKTILGDFRWRLDFIPLDPSLALIKGSKREENECQMYVKLFKFMQAWVKEYWLEDFKGNEDSIQYLQKEILAHARETLGRGELKPQHTKLVGKLIANIEYVVEKEYELWRTERSEHNLLAGAEDRALQSLVATQVVTQMRRLSTVPVAGIAKAESRKPEAGHSPGPTGSQVPDPSQTSQAGSVPSEFPSLISTAHPEAGYRMKTEHVDFIFQQQAASAARQMTLRNFQAYARIRKREFLGHGWKKGKDKSPNVVCMIDNWNFMTHFFELAMLRADGLKSRTTRMKWVVKLGEEFLKHRDYSSLCSVVTALNATPIYRLKTAWQRVPEKHRIQYDKYKGIFKSDMNMRGIRDAQKAAASPALPHIGIYLQDLLYIDELGSEDSEKQYCRSKAAQVAGRVNEIIMHQQEHFPFEENNVIQNILSELYEDMHAGVDIQSRVEEDRVWELSDKARKKDEEDKAKLWW